MRLPPPLLCAVLSLIAPASRAGAATAKEVTQYGITWTFDKAYPVGQFITGDWWVVGPVTIVGVSPAPAPGPDTEPATDGRSIYGAVALVDDRRCRNGSMIVNGPTKNGAFTGQGYDSRATNFDPALSVAYPCKLPVNQSLISTVSSETYKNGKVATPYVAANLFADRVKGLASPVEPLALDTAAVLTCLDTPPPADAFRPAYTGTVKTIYRAKDIRWDLLPNLKPVEGLPDWEKMARVYQRPWLDHMGDWTIQFTAPGQNQPAYGGVMTQMNAFASLLLLTDAPRAQKEKLLLGFLQYGIDLHGLAQNGRQWFSDGGHWMGRKWPLLFASLLLDKPEMRRFPQLKADTQALPSKSYVTAGPGETLPTTCFSEDMDTYYGKGADGQNVLWQVSYHSHPRRPFMELPFDQWTEDDKFANNYFWVGGNWSAFALSALYLKARADWNHDAFFDYCDWFMQPGQQKTAKDGQKKPTRNNTDKFVQAMWDAYRAGAPTQPGGKDNVKWEWLDLKASADGQKFSASKGHFVPNPKAP